MPIIPQAGQEKPQQVRVSKLTILATFQLLDEEGKVMEETNAEQPFTMFPGKYMPFTELVRVLEEKANANPAQVKALAARSLLGT